MIRGSSPAMLEDDRAPIWDVADADGRALATKISYVALRARIDAGLLPAAALIARSGEREWRPLTDVLTPSRTEKITSLWYITRKNARSIVGPVDTDRIIRGLASQRVPVDCVVCRTGEHEWRMLREVPEFMRAVREAQFDGELTLVVDTDTHVRAIPPPPFTS